MIKLEYNDDHDIKMLIQKEANLDVILKLAVLVLNTLDGISGSSSVEFSLSFFKHILEDKNFIQDTLKQGRKKGITISSDFLEALKKDDN